MPQMALVTGGVGFIGSAVCRFLVCAVGANVLNVDKLTYAANLDSLNPVEKPPRYRFRRADSSAKYKRDRLGTGARATVAGSGN